LRNVEENTVPKKDYDELEKSVEKKKAFIEQLQERVQELMIERSNLQCSVKSKNNIIEELEETIDELSKPWWKKIF
jgi:predicted nuclease with TOPRIM domain